MHRRAFAWVALCGLASLGAVAAPRRLVVSVEVDVPLRSADRIAAEVAAPLERAFAGLRGLVSMKSMSAASRCAIELGYADVPTADELTEARSAAEAAWTALNIAPGQPSVSIREARLTG